MEIESSLARRVLTFSHISIRRANSRTGDSDVKILRQGSSDEGYLETWPHMPDDRLSSAGWDGCQRSGGQDSPGKRRSRKPLAVPLGALDAEPCSSLKAQAPRRWLVRGDERRSKGRRFPSARREKFRRLRHRFADCLQRFHRLQPARQRPLRRRQVLVTDLDSSNGTYLNDRKIVREELKDNDMIRFGENIVKFKRL